VILVNRRDRVEWEEGMTVSALLTVMRYSFPRIIVSVDGELVPPEEYDSYVIPDHADVRLIHLMAGG
jgi:thiamine biosynthesis protein ThiS